MTTDDRLRPPLRSGAAGTGPDHPLYEPTTDDTAARIADTIIGAPNTAHDDAGWRWRWQDTRLKASDFGWPEGWD